MSSCGSPRRPARKLSVANDCSGSDRTHLLAALVRPSQVGPIPGGESIEVIARKRSLVACDWLIHNSGVEMRDEAMQWSQGTAPPGALR